MIEVYENQKFVHPNFFEVGKVYAAVWVSSRTTPQFSETEIRMDLDVERLSECNIKSFLVLDIVLLPWRPWEGTDLIAFKVLADGEKVGYLGLTDFDSFLVHSNLNAGSEFLAFAEIC